MTSYDDHELSRAIKDAASPDWAVRVAAGRQLAMSTRIEEMADVLVRLLLDAQDTGVTQETAHALLARKDAVGLRCVVMAMSRVTETWTADELNAALNGDAAWMTDEGTDRLILQLKELAGDADHGVRDEARRILAQIRRPEESGA
ncbi:hypothetical protein STRCI_008170 [Streptomyces cinnabarinus]|uniref:HEAT repeat domain-containing protein n=1 Tax=Streptomyces cinnabarinus TaxID=67287 RepID=A0ABY7KV17_9ACTN|nr:hypothetical protein [Streptomyces cinnabarinus]WAZ26576.1 hypothetical protein STRCI_008170 [Streptomyces cinnabarinus]